MSFGGSGNGERQVSTNQLEENEEEKEK